MPPPKSPATAVHPRAGSGLCILLCAACTTVAIAPAKTAEVLLHTFASPPPYGANPEGGVIRDKAGNLYGTTEDGGAYNLGVVFKVDTSGSVIVLHNFAGGADGANPEVGVILDPGGNMYGTTPSGGLMGQGTVYKIDPSGNETVLYSFTEGTGFSGVTLDSAGNLYGTTYYGGATSEGSVYKLDNSGVYTLLYSFANDSPGGANPRSGVILDAAGNLYGTTYDAGGASNAGTVYKIDPSGNEIVLHTFTGHADGGGPYSGLILDSAGNLYGTTYGGGSSSHCGVVYKLSASGQETVLHRFAGGADGCNPETGVVVDAAGNLYGTTYAGGTFDAGTVYEVGTSHQETVLYTFGAVVGSGPNGASTVPSGVFRDPAGNLYGTTRYGGRADLGVAFKLMPSGQEVALHNFTGPADGTNPVAGVARDSQGNLYGTTYSGGAANLGVVFKRTPSGQETVLHTFTYGTGGANPAGGVTLDSAGNLYGTAEWGGASGLGTVYKLDAAGGFTVLYTFSSTETDYAPRSAVVLDSAGNLYGSAASGCGSVYELDASGNYTVLYSFSCGYDGLGPSGVTRDSAGNLYGTANLGGCCDFGDVWKLDTSGNLTLLYSFTGPFDDGAYPVAGVTLDSAGNVYGTTSQGGTFNQGIVYKIDTSGRETVLHSFSGHEDGGAPIGGVIPDSAGNLYGTTSKGGQFGQGVVFLLTTAGIEKVLHSFAGGTDGGDPEGKLIFDATGNLYGTTYAGGAGGGGVIFELER